jgi:hypothetical protein
MIAISTILSCHQTKFASSSEFAQFAVTSTIFLRFDAKGKTGGLTTKFSHTLLPSPTILFAIRPMWLRWGQDLIDLILNALVGMCYVPEMHGAPSAFVSTCMRNYSVLTQL